MPTSKLRVIASMSVLLLAGHVACAQTPPAVNRIPCDSIMKRRASQETRTEQQSDFQSRITPATENRTVSSDTRSVLDAITSDRDFPPLMKARDWMSGSLDNARGMIAPLIGLLTDTTVVGLTNSADLIIWERIQSNDMEFYGHGWSVADDLFRVAGRASWLLKEITGRDFGTVHPSSSLSNLKKMQEQWAEWYSRFDCR